KSMDTTYLASNEELNEDSIVIRGLEPGHTYDFRVVAVDGVHETPSDPLPVYTYASLLWQVLQTPNPTWHTPDGSLGCY
ncbi:Uncharacterized protein FKW44_018668, partial [Caligus rogercresseyi]